MELFIIIVTILLIIVIFCLKPRRWEKDVIIELKQIEEKKRQREEREERWRKNRNRSYEDLCAMWVSEDQKKDPHYYKEIADILDNWYTIDLYSQKQTKKVKDLKMSNGVKIQ